MSSLYLPVQRKVLPLATSRPSVWIPWSFSSCTSLILEVLADDADEADLAEPARREGEVRGGAAEALLGTRVRGVDRVIGGRADDEDAHDL